MHAISLHQVSKHWGPARAVDGVSFEAEAGALLVLLGPSGCGKSTTLRLIAGLEQVDGGRILIDGKEVTNAAPSRRRIAMVFQSYALFPHLTAAENILFGLNVRRVPKPDRAARLKRVAALLGLDGLLERKPSQLSGGQQQRVALGRAVIAEQPVCLMDEPLSNLDAQLRQEMRREIRALQQSLGMTMVYVTHDQAEAMSMADRIILMRQGRVELDAPPPDLYQRPASLFVARFIGTPPMNILPLADGAGGAVVKGTAGPTVCEGRGEGLALGLRPEDLALSDSSCLPARITAIEYLGADTIVTGAVGDAAVAIRTAGGLRVRPGDTVRLAWGAAAEHFFDVTTGLRIEDAMRSRHDAGRRAFA